MTGGDYWLNGCVEGNARCRFISCHAQEQGVELSQVKLLQYIYVCREFRRFFHNE